MKNNAPQDQLSLVVFSGDLDRLLAAFILAVGAAAMYERVVLFFTFWGITALRDKNVLSLEDLMKTAAEFGVEIVICEMSMGLMGFTMDEMIDYPNVSLGGDAKYLQEAADSKVSLFL